MDQWRRKQIETGGGLDLSEPPSPGPNAYVDVEETSTE